MLQLVTEVDTKLDSARYRDGGWYVVVVHVTETEVGTKLNSACYRDGS